MTPKFCLGSCLYSQPLPVTCAFKPGALVWVSKPQLWSLRCRGRCAQLREPEVIFLNLLLFLFNQIAKIKFIKKGDLNVLKALTPHAMPHESLLHMNSSQLSGIWLRTCSKCWRGPTNPSNDPSPPWIGCLAWSVKLRL